MPLLPISFKCYECGKRDLTLQEARTHTCTIETPDAPAAAPTTTSQTGARKPRRNTSNAQKAKKRKLFQQSQMGNSTAAPQNTTQPSKKQRKVEKHNEERDERQQKRAAIRDARYTGESGLPQCAICGTDIAGRYSLFNDCGHKIHIACHKGVRNSSYELKAKSGGLVSTCPHCGLRGHFQRIILAERTSARDSSGFRVSGERKIREHPVAVPDTSEGPSAPQSRANVELSLYSEEDDEIVASEDGEIVAMSEDGERQALEEQLDTFIGAHPEYTDWMGYRLTPEGSRAFVEWLGENWKIVPGGLMQDDDDDATRGG